VKNQGMNTSLPKEMLRVLIINSQPLIDENGSPLAMLAIEEERRRVKEALKRATNELQKIEIHFLFHATVSGIIDATKQEWDIVHFSGHGRESGQLLLENTYGKAHKISASEIVHLFGEHIPKLVVLSVCYSGKNIANALIDLGVQSIVTIKADTPISDRAAIIFNFQFYNHLFTGYCISEAFERAKKNVALDPEIGDEAESTNLIEMNAEPWSYRFELIGNGNLKFDTKNDRDVKKTALEKQCIVNLPQRSANFVGRENEIVNINELLESQKIVGIVGTGGIGKTELANSIGWWYAERKRVDAVIWLSANRIEPYRKITDNYSFLRIIAQVVGIRLSSNHLEFSELRNLVINKLSSFSSLLILDNLEALSLGAKKRLWDLLLNFPDPVKVLITSRELLPPKNAHNYELTGLTLGQSVGLIRKIATNTGYCNNNSLLLIEETSILASICEKLDGHPLALELVASQTSFRSLSAIWDDLLHFPDRIFISRDEFTGKDRGLWQSLQITFDSLSNSEKAFFRRTGILINPVTFKELEWFAHLDIAMYNLFKKGDNQAKQDSELIQEVEFHILLEALVRRSLIKIRDGKYYLLPVIRQYAEHQLLESGQDLVFLHITIGMAYSEFDAVLRELVSVVEYPDKARFRFWDHLFEVGNRNFYNEKFNDDYSFAVSSFSFFLVFALEGYENLVKKESPDIGKVYLQKLVVVIRTLKNSKSSFSEGNLSNQEVEILRDLSRLNMQTGSYDDATRTFSQYIALASLLDQYDSLDISIAWDKAVWAVAEVMIGNLQKAAQLYEEASSVFKVRMRKDLIAESMEMLGIAMTEVKEISLGIMNLLIAFSIYKENGLNSQAERTWLIIEAYREKIGDDVFADITTKISQSTQKFLDRSQEDFVVLATYLEAIVILKKNGSVEEILEFSQEMKMDEITYRDMGNSSYADFFLVLRNILLDKYDSSQLYSLQEPYKSLVSQILVELQNSEDGGE
jgi:hypothetical protein